MQTHAEAVGPVVTGLAAALGAADPVTDLLTGADAAIHLGEAPISTASGEPLPDYIVITSPSGEDDSVFMKKGAAVRATIDLWCATQQRVLDLYAEVGKVLDLQTIDLGTGFTLAAGLTRLLTAIRDPGRRHMYHGIVQYEALVR